MIVMLMLINVLGLYVKLIKMLYTVKQNSVIKINHLQDVGIQQIQLMHVNIPQMELIALKKNALKMISLSSVLLIIVVKTKIKIGVKHQLTFKNVNGVQTELIVH